MYEEALHAYNGKKIRTKKERDYVETLRHNYAFEFKRENDPPLEYDHPYAGNLTIERVADPEALLVQCPTLKNAVGCAKFPQDRSWCKIFIVSDEYINSKSIPATRTLFGYSYQNFLRHELAHCNGWPADHPR